MLVKWGDDAAWCYHLRELGATDGFGSGSLDQRSVIQLKLLFFTVTLRISERVNRDSEKPTRIVMFSSWTEQEMGVHVCARVCRHGGKLPEVRGKRKKRKKRKKRNVRVAPSPHGSMVKPCCS